jgi:hypothetical protein
LQLGAILGEQQLVVGHCVLLSLADGYYRIRVLPQSPCLHDLLGDECLPVLENLQHFKSKKKSGWLLTLVFWGAAAEWVTGSQRATCFCIAT